MAVRALAALATALSGGAPSARLSNVLPRHDTAGRIVNAHAGGVYNFSGRFYLLGEHYRSCPHAGSNKTLDPLAVGNCEICGHTGTTFALYESADLQSWALTTTNVIPQKPGGADAELYTPVLSPFNAAHGYHAMVFQCTGGCPDGQIQVATAVTPAGPFEPKGALLPSSDPRHPSSQAGIWVDEEGGGVGYLVFNSIGSDPTHNGQWIVELDDTYLAMTNRSAQIVPAGQGQASEGERESAL